jgi:hypothetical protein
MLAILQILEALHTADCDLCKDDLALGGRPGPRRTNIEEASDFGEVSPDPKSPAEVPGSWPLLTPGF